MVVIRYEGPKGDEAMEGNAFNNWGSCWSRLKRKCIPNYRRKVSGGSTGAIIGHLGPQTAVGGPIAAEDGDTVEIDLESLVILQISSEEIAERLKLKPRKPVYEGTLEKYIKLVQPASKGAVTN